MLPSGDEAGGVAIRPGLRIGRYEVVSAIGAGGMGEVWKARDTTLHRDVAIKALPERVSQDTERVGRLQREAHLLAALNHPNIAVIHGLEPWGDTRVLVLELVDGVTLADRLLKGPLSVTEALTLALQIADSVEAAHEKGIIHRDLKPANIKITSDGRIKVLDFGIAKTIESGVRGEFHETTTLTETGTVIGMPSHMAPEQVRGEAAGSQADIWSFGVVLYEMLTGESPFRAATSADTLARVLDTDPDPDYTQLPGQTPPRVRALVQRCLEKDRRRRFQHMGDVRFEIEEALAAPRATAAIAERPLSSRRHHCGHSGVSDAEFSRARGGQRIAAVISPRLAAGHHFFVVRHTIRPIARFAGSVYGAWTRTDRRRDSVPATLRTSGRESWRVRFSAPSSPTCPG